jgi:dipeptidase
MKNLLISLAVLLLMLPSIQASACTNFLITKGASTDGSTMISYAADSHLLFGELYYTPAQDHAAGSMRIVVEWDTGKILGKIPQIPHTYSVVGNVNEHQVAIGETTYGGRDGLVDTTAIIDYGSLIYIALERSKNAREAIKVMTDLVETYGYYSSGESF